MHPDAYAPVPLAVMRNRDLPQGARLTYGFLLHYARQDGYCFPHVTTLADDLGVGVRQMREYLTKLADVGLISVEVRRGRSRPNIYRLMGHVPADTEAGSPAENRAYSAGIKEENRQCSADIAAENRNSSAPENRAYSAGPIGLKAEGLKDSPNGEGSVSHDTGATAPGAVAQEPGPTGVQDAPPPAVQTPTTTPAAPPVQTTGRPRRAPVQAESAPAVEQKPRQEQPQYRVFLALCRAAEANPLDMDGHKGRALSDATRALKALTARYTTEARADAAADAERDLCGMVTWKVAQSRRERRGKPLQAGLVWMAYQDMAAWRMAGSPGGVPVAPPAPSLRIVPPWERPKVAPAPPEPVPAWTPSPEAQRNRAIVRAAAADSRWRRYQEAKRQPVPPPVVVEDFDPTQELAIPW